MKINKTLSTSGKCLSFFLLAFSIIFTPATTQAVMTLDTSTAEEHEAEIELIRDLNSTIDRLEDSILGQEEFLKGTTSDREQDLIRIQIRVLKKQKLQLETLLGRFTGELTLKGIPVEELLEEAIEEQREQLDDELERFIEERRETELRG